MDGPAIDLTGTAWQAVQLRGAPIPGRAPELWFDFAGRPSGSGYTGCEDFGWNATFVDRTIRVDELVMAPFDCEREPDRSVEIAFLKAFRAAVAYQVGGDTLAIAGPEGEVLFSRLAPPIDDPSRAVFDLLRQGDWALIRAPGVAAPDLLARAQFADRQLVSVGDCGYSGRVRFGAGGLVQFEDVGWDSMACPGDAEARERDRQALARALQVVNLLAPGAGGGVRFAGQGVEVIFGLQRA